MPCKAVFCDVDGTLLTSDHRLLPRTRAAVLRLQKDGIPFAIVSARSPSGILPILREHGFRCPMVCYSGALILDETGRTLTRDGLSKAAAERVLASLDTLGMDVTWNVYAHDTWLVKDRRDARVKREESIVRACATEGRVADLPDDMPIGKVLCMCEPGDLRRVARHMQAAFPALTVVPSTDRLLEIMAGGVSKSCAVRFLCRHWGIAAADTAAFGDHFNDVPMLSAVGMPFLMGNAPEALKRQGWPLTQSNDDDGVYWALKGLGMAD